MLMHLGDYENGLDRTGDAASMGISKHQLSRKASPRLVRGIYLKDKAPIDFEAQAGAHLAASGPHAVLSHFSAATSLGGVVPHHSRFHVTVTSRHHIRRTGVTAHRTRRQISVTNVRGLAVTSGLQTFLDRRRWWISSTLWFSATHS